MSTQAAELRKRAQAEDTPANEFSALAQQDTELARLVARKKSRWRHGEKCRCGFNGAYAESLRSIAKSAEFHARCPSFGDRLAATLLSQSPLGLCHGIEQEEHQLACGRRRVDGRSGGTIDEERNENGQGGIGNP